ncbi:hypothetical protein ABH966_003106 [Lysinibacillus sp. RC46]|uniref:hypothetical protein n=1 Tax=Lysinibacillus sp. RC46 TaxID=3156295 RepID=UPI0035152F46
MDLREKLQRHLTKNKYEKFPGIKFEKILLSNEYTENEDRETEYVYKTYSIPNERIDNRCDKEHQIAWIKERVTPYLEKGHDVILIDNGFGVQVTILDTEEMLDFYLNSILHIGLSIINRSLKKFLNIQKEEYDFLFFIRDI